MATNFGWDARGFRRPTGIDTLDRSLAEIQDGQDCGYAPAATLAEIGVDYAHGDPQIQFRDGRIALTSGAILSVGQSWRSVWACTRLPDGSREPCNGSCWCCHHPGGQCEGQSTCPEHCPISVGQAAAMGILASRPHADA